MQHERHFVVMRVDRRGALPSAYLRKFAVTGRNGLRQLAFGPAATAHAFERRFEAEDIARRLRRRVPTDDYDFVVEEVPTMATASPAAD